MLKLQSIKLSFVVLGLLMWHGVATAGRSDQMLRSGDVTTYSPADTALGDFFYVNVSIPSGIDVEDLSGVILNCFLDVGTRAVQMVSESEPPDTVDYHHPAPTLEVYSLIEEWRGDFDEEILDESSSIKVIVEQGQDRLVRIDITEIVRSYVEDPSGNHGILIGSLTKSRRGLFQLKEGFGAGVRARITYYW